MASLLPTPEPPDPVEGMPGHFEHTNWVKASLKALDTGAARIDGSVPLDKVIVDSSMDETANVVLRGSARTLTGRSTSDFARWQLVLGDGTSEGGADSGSLFRLYAFADNGGLKHTVLAADRVTGLLTVTGSPTAAKGIATKEYSDAQIPIGAIIAFGSGTLPVEMQSKWHLCDGSVHGSAVLQAVISSTNAPDLRGRFIVGVSPTRAVGAKGGVETVTLTAAQSGVAAHGHTASMDIEDADHTHSINPPNTRSGDENANHYHSIDPPNTNTTTDTHSHTLSIREGTGENDGYYLDTNPTDSGTTKTLSGSKTSDDSHYHAVNIAPFNSGYISNVHQHYVDIPAFNSGGIQGTGHRHALTVAAATAANAAQSHDNMPPFYALTYIIKKA